MDNKILYRGKVLVIGNDHYDQLPQLENAINDAKAIHNAFQELDFFVMPAAYDINIDTFDSLFEEFRSDLDCYDVGIMYFAGHGVEIEGKNYLVMKNTPKTTVAASMIRYSVDLQDCLRELHKTGCKMIIIIVDACRDNPFDGPERGWGSVNLAPIFAPKGTMIAYSTSPGETASDFGMEGHSVYTGALLKHLQEEGLEIESFFKKVRSTVDTMTKGKKTSWEHTSLIGTFSFNLGKMVHLQNLGYDLSAIQDKNYVSTDEQIQNILSQLKIYDWYKQKPAIIEFEKIAPETINDNDLFVIGRNLLQAADGNSNKALSFLQDANKLSQYTIKGENHLLNGVLFEMYFDRDGAFRYKTYKTSLLDTIIKYLDNVTLYSSFEFITTVLRAYLRYIMYIPSKDSLSISINVLVSRGTIDIIGGEENATFVQSISFDGNELLADDDEDDVLGFLDWEKINEQQLKRLLAREYAIPTSKLTLIFNEDMGVKKFWLKKNFKRKIRN